MIAGPPLAPTLSALGDDPRAALERLPAAGFRFVQLSATQPGLKPRELDRSARRGLMTMLRRLELEPAGIDLWIPPAHFLAAAQIDRAVDAVLAAIELAADFGRCPLSLTLPASNGKDDAEPLKSAIEAIIAKADRAGVRLADHAVPMPSRPLIGIGVDSAAWLGASADPADIATQAGDRLVSARLCDVSASGMRQPVSADRDGRLNVLTYRAALSVIGFKRPTVVDARNWSDPWTGLAQSATAWSMAI